MASKRQVSDRSQLYSLISSSSYCCTPSDLCEQFAYMGSLAFENLPEQSMKHLAGTEIGFLRSARQLRRISPQQRARMQRSTVQVLLYFSSLADWWPRVR